MKSELILEWTQEDREEAVAAAVAAAVKEATVLAKINNTREHTIDILAVRLNRIPKSIKNRLQFIDRLELLEKLHQKSALVSSIDEFEGVLRQAEEELDTLVY